MATKSPRAPKLRPGHVALPVDGLTVHAYVGHAANPLVTTTAYNVRIYDRAYVGGKLELVAAVFRNEEAGRAFERTILACTTREAVMAAAQGARDAMTSGTGYVTGAGLR